MSHNQLSEAEAERLAFLVGELGEAVAEIGRVLRFQYASTSPDQAVTNRQAVEREIGDVFHAVTLMMINGDISPAAIKQRIHEKSISCRPYLFHQNTFVDIDLPF